MLTGFNDFQTKNPSLAKEWHPTKNGDIKPSQVITKTNTVYWWLGACGHEWKASPHNRSVGAGCTYCKGNNILSGFNDLETLNPALAKEWHPTLNGELKPSMVTKHNNNKAWRAGAPAISNNFTGTTVTYAGGGGGKAHTGGGPHAGITQATQGSAGGGQAANRGGGGNRGGAGFSGVVIIKYSVG